MSPMPLYPSSYEYQEEMQRAHYQAQRGLSFGSGIVAATTGLGIQYLMPSRGRPLEAPKSSKKELTFKDELQDEIDEWLKDI